jgi:hypothetical protein
VKALPGFVQTPVAKVGIHRLPRRKIMRQHTPLTAGAQGIQDGINDLPPHVVSGTPSTFHGRNQRFEELPF